ncbi:riboflavin synthase [Paroceanicella profunda]|uniref:Riboflavin synthase n=1 Tax=Paroceanicella profunda TaxID=2579971 RepID=A0A5B8FHM8_9RHOB|nr:riboflavin synthase [Paroceanicella profunda]QDL92208.1 riboflavin synthase [Paroceanicella profunda]
MFTGIITDIGEILEITLRGDTRMRIACGYDMAGVALGASICCDGVCLTVVDKGTLPAGGDTATSGAGAAGNASGTGKGGSASGAGMGRSASGAGRGWFDVDASAETLSLTTLGGWSAGTRINLERALRVGDELGGHIVSGHVDGTAEILSLTPEGDSIRYRFRAPKALARFIAPKGSVALNGTSLTVNEVDGPDFGVNIIPHTRAETTWGDARAGDRVNLEIDTLARYVARLAEMTNA